MQWMKRYCDSVNGGGLHGYNPPGRREASKGGKDVSRKTMMSQSLSKSKVTAVAIKTRNPRKTDQPNVSTTDQSVKVDRPDSKGGEPSTEKQEALIRNLGMEVVSTDQSDHEFKSAIQTEDPEQHLDTSPSLDKDQNTLTSDGKNSGSMNLDEFLSSIWTAEENEAQPQNGNPMVPTAEANKSITNMNPKYHFGQTPNESSNVARKMCLTRQGSPSVPAPPCLETAEEEWSKISRTQQSSSNIPQASSRLREPSYGEMTLQEFLVKLGVVREEGAVAQIPPPRPHYLQPQYHFQPHPAPPVFQPRPLYQPQYHLQPHPAPPVFQPRPAPPLLPRPQLPYGMYSNYNSTTMSNFMITGCGTGSVGVPTPFGPQPQAGGATVATCFSGGRSNATGLQPAVRFPGVASGVRAIENFAERSAFPLDGIGRKRMIDKPREMMTERYRKRMIRNRESAIRSRARKQAYKIELEAVILQLKHEKADLGQRLKEIESKYKLQNWSNLIVLK